MIQKTLKQLREENNLTQKQIAHILTISVTGYASWEQGKSEPNIAMLIKIADYYEVTVDYLIGRKDY